MSVDTECYGLSHSMGYERGYWLVLKIRRHKDLCVFADLWVSTAMGYYRVNPRQWPFQPDSTLREGLQMSRSYSCGRCHSLGWGERWKLIPCTGRCEETCFEFGNTGNTTKGCMVEYSLVFTGCGSTRERMDCVRDIAL